MVQWNPTDLQRLKPIHWIGSSRSDLREFPDEVRRDIGFALSFAQEGEKHSSAKPLKGFKGAGVLEIVEDHQGAKMKTRVKKDRAPEAGPVTRGSDNVFVDLGFSPSEAADLKVKAELTLQIYRRIKELGLTQVRAAGQLGVSQPDVSKLMNGRHAGYSVDRLLALLNALEVDIDIVVRPKHHGRSMRRGVVRVMEIIGAPA